MLLRFAKIKGVKNGEKISTLNKIARLLRILESVSHWGKTDNIK